MPSYDFLCEKCGEGSTFSWSIAEYDRKLKAAKCPKCKSKKMHRNYSECDWFVSVKEVKTIGQLAEKNTKKLGGQLKEAQAMKQEVEEKKKPWHHKCGKATRKQIHRMSAKQKHEYVTKGVT